MNRSLLSWPLEKSVTCGTVSPDERASETIPVLRPRLPLTQDLLPYLQTIDRAAQYTNFGPLVTSLEAQLSRYLGRRDQAVTTASSGTSALTATLLALQLPADAECLMPSWTFAATPHAARAAGLTPFFHDVDAATWALNPDQVRRTLEQTPRRVGVVMVVSPFGAPLDVKAWKKFEAETGVRVVIDAAAGFDTVRASSIPAVVSLHATKVLGAGEGGFIATTDLALLQRIKVCSNFGFNGTRISEGPAVNSKLSEYHAAVVLANLDAWPETRRQHLRILEQYRERMEKLEGVCLQPGYGLGWVTGTTNVVLPQRSAAAVSERLLAAGIETRRWWSEGCHVQPAFKDCPRTALPVTEDLGSRVLGLPHFPGMEEAQVNQVIQALSTTLPGVS